MRKPPPKPTANSSMWHWQFNGGSVGCITQTAGAPFPTIPSTAWLMFRCNVVHNNVRHAACRVAALSAWKRNPRTPVRHTGGGGDSQSQ
eukprot:COSAG01_NODE_2483_length_7600_cov_4.742034_4_plen_89_part_00